MAEEEVSYASVTFKSNKQPASEVKKEETVYDAVKVQKKATEQPPDTNASPGILTDKNSDSRCRHYQQLACCLGSLSILLVVGIIAASVYFATFVDENVVTELKQLKENQTALTAANRNLTNLNYKLSSDNEDLKRNQTVLTLQNHNLTNLNYKLSSDNEDLKRNQTVLTLQNHNLTQASTVLKQQVTNLTAENQNLTQKNVKLETEKKNLETEKQKLEAENQNLTQKNKELEAEKKKLTEQIQYRNTSWKELNVSRAQWSIDAYCPKETNNRQCKPCQKGWLNFQSSCYVVNDVGQSDLKTWEEARENCTGKISDLVDVINADEKTFVSNNSWVSSGIKGYWIGLRAEAGKWKWVDGSDLTDTSWIQQPVPDGSCAISVKGEGFKSVSCDEKNRWICKKKSLSL